MSEPPPCIFIDACCICRQFDDQSQSRIKIETEAFGSIMAWVERGDLIWIGSSALRFELAQNKDSVQRGFNLALFDTFCRSRLTRREDLARANEIQSLGFGTFDSLHMAVAELSECSAFLTTDDRLLKGVNRWQKKLNVMVANPLDWTLQRLSR